MLISDKHAVAPGKMCRVSLFAGKYTIKVAFCDWRIQSRTDPIAADFNRASNFCFWLIVGAVGKYCFAAFRVFANRFLFFEHCCTCNVVQ